MEALREEYSKKLQKGELVHYRFHTYNNNIRELTLNLIGQYLAQVHLNHLQISLSTFFTEIINNAIKANLKRVYFKSRRVNIDDPDEYNEAMEGFNEKVMGNIDSFVPLLQQEHLSVEISMQQGMSGLAVQIVNNTGMNAHELKRVQSRLQEAVHLQSMEEALEHFVDLTEGGGLGLILNLILLKKIGIDPENFQLTSDGKRTVSRLLIPTSVGKPEHTRHIEEKILQEIQMIPSFPETVNQVLEMCDNPKSSASQVSSLIEKDPGLAADILKLANSGAYITANKAGNISAAVGVLGLKTVRKITLASASRSLLDKHFQVFRGFWEHSFKCAFYAKSIAERYRMVEEVDNAYLGGLLHDLGKIILYSIDPEGMEKINDITIDKTRTNSATLEEIRLGVSHAHIGALVAENWGFSEELVEIIRNHHRPFAVREKYRRITSIVHIANAFCNIDMDKGKYVYIDMEAYNQLGIRKPEDIQSLHQFVQKAYEDATSRAE